MPKCPICGKEYSEAAFCPDCGIKLDQPKGESYSHGQTGKDDLDKPLGMWDYVLMELVAKIPIVNLVLFCVWGFSSGSNLNRKNWARSRLIWAAIGLVGGLLLAMLGMVLFGAIGVTGGVLGSAMHEILYEIL